jgi:hypothetical protein
MTDIIELAQECKLIGMRPHLDGIYQAALEQFAALVAAHEREACAAMFDNRNVWDEEVGERIRARGTT